MVRLDQITTGTGDSGTTSLADGSRVSKADPRVAAYGTVDELNSLIGVALAELAPGDMAAELRRVQNDLFDLGADIATPLETDRPVPRVEKGQVKRLEEAIRTGAQKLEPAESFVLPGGSREAALLHLARAVARRAEREVLLLGAPAESAGGGVNPQVLTYLNRLSDLLFVYARQCNDCGRADVLWRPGAGRGVSKPQG